MIRKTPEDSFNKWLKEQPSEFITKIRRQGMRRKGNTRTLGSSQRTGLRSKMSIGYIGSAGPRPGSKCSYCHRPL